MFWTEVDRADDSQYALAVNNFFDQPSVKVILDKLGELEEAESPRLCIGNGQIQEIKGYVYAAWNPLFADMVKIGATTRQPYIRVAELASSGVPEPFQLVASIPCINPFKLEHKIHQHYASVRKYGRKKELFELSRDTVVDYFHSLSNFTNDFNAGQEKKMNKRPRSDKSYEREEILKKSNTLLCEHIQLRKKVQELDKMDAKLIKDRAVLEAKFIKDKAVLEANIIKDKAVAEAEAMRKQAEKILCEASTESDIIRQDAFDTAERWKREAQDELRSQPIVGIVLHLHYLPERNNRSSFELSGL
jgi:hypothetical protein